MRCPSCGKEMTITTKYNDLAICVECGIDWQIEWKVSGMENVWCLDRAGNLIIWDEVEVE